MQYKDAALDLTLVSTMSPIGLYECQECGAVVSQRSLHNDWHKRVKTKRKSPAI